MATFLDVGLLGNFSVIFVALLVFLVLFGVLEMVNAFKNRGLHAVISIIIALLFLVSKSAILMITTIVPWFVVFGVIVFFILLVPRVFGATNSGILALTKDSTVQTFIVIFSIIIILFGVGKIFGQGLLEKGEGASIAEMQGNFSGPYPQGYTPEGVRQLPPSVVDSRSTTTPDFGTNLINTLRHPKVLGVIFIMVMGMFMLFFLTKPIAVV